MSYRDSCDLATLLFNNNIRCIEINLSSEWMKESSEFNNNIRCIEIINRILKHLIKKRLITT